MTAKPRRSYETGHRPKFLSIIDETPESDKALRFAARRAARTGASLILLAVAPPGEFEFLGVGDVMRAEAEEEAAALVEVAAAKAREIAHIEAEKVVRMGTTSDEIAALIEEDEDITFLVLATSVAKDGPGPLVSTLISKGSGDFPVPLVIVPGNLTNAEIDALAG